MDKTRQAKAESLHEWKSQMADFLLERAQKFGDITLHIKAADLIGMKEVIRRKNHSRACPCGRSIGFG